MRLLLVLFFCACGTIVQAEVLTDSVGTETNDGITYILHEVGDKETLYSLSRRYNVPIYKIIESNPPTEYGLDEGEIIKIPVLSKELKKQPSISRVEQVKEEITTKVEPKNPVVVPTDQSEEIISHEVQPKETLFSLSRKYNVSVTEIKEWNKLTSNSLDIGQIIKIVPKSTDLSTEVLNQGKTHEVKPSETLYSISRLYELSLADLKVWNDLEGNELSIGQLLFIEPPKKDVSIKNKVIAKPATADTIKQIVQQQPIDTSRYNIQPKRTNFEEVIEAGLAEQIGGSTGNRKYLALHKTAKTGTLIRVRNEMNNQELWVRVIGPLPDTSDNKNLVVKISKAAYDRLGAIDPRFRVTLTYFP